jgi:lipoprotein-anchoring transpeptidase ErfK/SrfK
MKFAPFSLLVIGLLLAARGSHPTAVTPVTASRNAGPAATTTVPKKPVKFVEVDLNLQRLYAYEGDKKVMDFPVSTGRKGMETPDGEFQVLEKQVVGKALKKYGGGKLPHAQRIHGHVLIHGYASVPSYPASHGCVRMKPDDAKKLFGWTEVGTRVYVYTGVSDCLL